MAQLCQKSYRHELEPTFETALHKCRIKLLHLQRVTQLTPEKLISRAPSRKTTNRFDIVNSLDPVKFSPPAEAKETQYSAMYTGHLTYSSVTKLNPFAGEERYAKVEDFLHTDAEKTPKAIPPQVPPKLPPKAYKSPRMMHSQSEGNVVFRHEPPSSSAGSQSSHMVSSSEEDRTRISEDTASSSSFSRGRPRLRTPSPNKELERIQEVQPPQSPPFSPSKRSRSPLKRFLGEKGWLGKSMSMNEMPSGENRKSPFRSLGSKIKKGVGNITDNVSKSIPSGTSPSRSKSRGPSTFHVSLSPPMQAKLYSEIELMICATANQYLNDQVTKDRMSIESLQKVISYWEAKNRPQVIEFMFNQGTQRELIQANLETFRFYGPTAANVVAMNSMMRSWKTLAKEMSVRTFCTPDSAVRKHLQDTYKILEFLGAPLVTFLAFQEISIKAMKIITEEQKRKDGLKTVTFGVERQWQVPRRSAEEVERLERENPFA
ncbi:uncharacterized protein KY384_007662 [Bacidia gigantensis]|uniref:uncharacterized protein n=1 Tax=Bacidia gigantensis TaxID=2732470 RepID=UPI001D041C3B|nr:uncharacterized protein KY384_007662 [Bacidia gigantensis]KAG8527510.1 hypothetical protein KY384_007662 [Bacidia gigantensis]